MRALRITVAGFVLVLALAAAARAAVAPEKGPAAPAAASASVTTAATATATATPIPPPSASTPAPQAAPVAPLPSAATPVLTTSQPRAGVLRDPVPRPATDVRVQARFAVKANSVQLFAGAEYLSRGDFYNSPGVRAGVAYYPLEPLGLELQISHYWSSLNAEAERVKKTLGALPDSHAPAWLFLAGLRYSIGYGKLMIGGLGGAIHFEPQAFAHAGGHAHDGDAGPSGDAGLGLLVFLKPKLFVRLDAAIVYEREDRSGQSVAVWGTLPSLSVGGTP